ncbi:Hypothetical protein PHPALM_18912 [Phytophthora palmivora]|uniref:Uncharacterized protein n=1 Tax=Phytophthora palmivora TaxID=4796 RepID=A0A2P4XIJ7_9STRA|nr:Hypothetical protein PHPALM_18912 [Phytophthora palmivora]
MFEPVMEHLAGLSSPAFYTSLKSWKEIVKKGMQGATAYFSDTTTNPDENAEEASMDDNCESNSSDASSEIGPDEMFDTIKMIQDMEQNTNAKHTNLHTKAAIKQKHPSCATRYPEKCGQIEVLQLPRQKQRCNQRKRTKQSRLQTKTKPQKLAAISLPDKNVPSLSRLLDWANASGDRYHVSEILENYPVIMSDDFAGARAARSRREYVRNSDYDYNFVIPEFLVTKLDAVVEAERKKRQKPACLVDTNSDYPAIPQRKS